MINLEASGLGVQDGGLRYPVAIDDHSILGRLVLKDIVGLVIRAHIGGP